MTVTPLSVGSVIGRVFPNGTRILSNENKTKDSKIKNKFNTSTKTRKCPDWPPDLFAVSEYLLDIAGAYQYFLTSTPYSSDCDELNPSKNGFGLNKKAYEECLSAGIEWRSFYKIPKTAENLWKELNKYRDSHIFHETSGRNTDACTPEWWPIAYRLMIIADHACQGVGHGISEHPLPHEGTPSTGSWVALVQASERRDAIDGLIKKFKKDNVPDDKESNKTIHISLSEQRHTLCNMADPDVVCVQAKSRSANIGCSTRNQTLNLSLLPPRGIVRSIWHNTPFFVKRDDSASLNILLIPYPFRMSARSIKNSPIITNDLIREHKINGTMPWGRFLIHQSWINGEIDIKDDDRSNQTAVRRESLIIFTEELIKSAKRDVEAIHGVIFPEYALDWDTHHALVNRLSNLCPKLEFIVSGSSDNCVKLKGNFALSTVFTHKPENNNLNKTVCISTSRAKHHRWRLDERQISTYALASALDPRYLWWEDIPLLKREVHVNVFRDTSTFAAMICEDLARIDPCHPILRAMAPNLVFVLLMDGPQLPNRWSARYATALAEDPGSSVLTLTSTALMQRSNRTNSYPENWSIALWKDDSGSTVPITCDCRAHGVVLTLSGYRTTEISLDGRTNPLARAWRYHGHQPVTIDIKSKKSKYPADLMNDIISLTTGESEHLPDLKSIVEV